MLTEQNGTSVYRDEIVEIKVGVDPLKDGIQLRYHRNLANCIKIMAYSPSAHFIQFVTRQVPNLFLYEQSNQTILGWDVVFPHYMKDATTPKWKLDITEDSISCFYDEKGLNLKTERFISMYDYPGGSYEFNQERAVFCTFVVLNDQITHLIKWSKEKVQKEAELVEHYSVNVQLWNKPLPFWAIKILQEFYSVKNKELPAELGLRNKIAGLREMEEDSINEESKAYFLTPPQNWLTLLEFPGLFSRVEKMEFKILEEAHLPLQIDAMQQPGDQLQTILQKYKANTL